MDSLSTFPELRLLERVITLGAGRLRTQTDWIPDLQRGRQWPVHTIYLGTSAPEAPAVGFFGGVHGLERIGAQVVIDHLHSLVMRLSWDTSLEQLLERVRLVFMPLVNPGGMARGTRANPAGIDLMRNAPLDAQGAVLPLIGGHRVSAWLPWYRGRTGDPMEPEARLLCEVVERELLGRPFALALDCHSGFGLRDRLWFPYAHCPGPIAALGELHALQEIFAQTHAHHPYVFEPQNRHYLAHGDLWDYLCLKAADSAGQVFLPLTLEMGSWLWVKKNPRQLFSRGGFFNPLITHRHERVLRRHLPLLDFAARASASYERWLPTGDALARHRRAGRALWYGQRDEF